MMLARPNIFPPFPPHTLCFPIQSISLSLLGENPKGRTDMDDSYPLSRGGKVKKGLKNCTAPRSTFHIFLKKAGQALETGDICST